MASRLEGVFDRLVDAAAFMAGLLLVFQVSAVCADVILRLLFNSPVHGVTALTEWSLLYIAFLAAAWLQREHGHVSVDLLASYLPARLEKALALIAASVGLFVTGVLVVFGVWVTYNKYVEAEYDFFKLPWMPLFLIYGVIPLGSILWFVQILRQAAQTAQRPSVARKRQLDQ
jgi:TRAP-type C4-dicarboxylate transport system permease small subunit